MRHLLATLGLGPLLVFQGIGVRRSVPILPEAAGPRRGTAGPRAAVEGPATTHPFRLLLVGDSSACGVGVDDQSQALLGRLVDAVQERRNRVEYRLEGATGATTADALERLESLDRGESPEGWDLVVTALGVNDVVKSRSLRRFVREQRELVRRLREHHRARQIVLSGLPPVHLFPALPQPLRWYLGERARDFDRALRSLADQEGCLHVPLDAVGRDTSAMATDGFHPGAPAYATWADRIVDALPASH